MVDFSDSPPEITFRLETSQIERALSHASGVAGTVIRNDSDASNAITQLIRINGINEVDSENYSFEVDVGCEISDEIALVTVTGDFGSFPSNAAESKEAAKAFQDVVQQIQKILSDD